MDSQIGMERLYCSILGVRILGDPSVEAGLSVNQFN